MQLTNKILLAAMIFFATIANAAPVNNVNNKVKNIPEFVGGINNNDVDVCYQHIENFCAEEKNSGNFADYTQCITPYMQDDPTCTQPLALQKAVDSMYSAFKKILHHQSVDLVQATTIMADKSSSILLIGYNGDLINVDDFPLDLKTAKNYAAFAKKFHHMEQFEVLYPPAVQNLPNGNIRFVFKREVHDGCRACATVAYAKMAFDFDKNGKFTGAKLLTLLPIDTKK